MKLFKLYYVKQIFCILANIFMLWALSEISSFPKGVGHLKTMLIIIVGIAVLILMFIIADTYFKGAKYKKIEMVPIEDFRIEERKNIFIVTFREQAYAVPLKYKMNLEVDEIKVTHYYNRKKKEISWYLHLPYLTQ